MKEHHYKTHLRWTGNRGEGTRGYRSYDRGHTISVEGKPDLPGSSDPSFRGDKTRYNPEELLVSSLSACHMLWYLHVCSDAGIVITGYEDGATGTMVETSDGGGHFSEVTLHPKVSVLTTEMIAPALALHAKAHALCYVARSVNFPVHIEPEGSSEKMQ